MGKDVCGRVENGERDFLYIRSTCVVCTEVRKLLDENLVRPLQLFSTQP